MTTSAGSGTEDAPVPGFPISQISVPLIPTVQQDLQRLQERTRLSKTDIVNRAISVYDFIDAQLRAGHDVIIRDKRTGETRLIRLL